MSILHKIFSSFLLAILVFVNVSYACTPHAEQGGIEAHHENNQAHSEELVSSVDLSSEYNQEHPEIDCNEESFDTFIRSNTQSLKKLLEGKTLLVLNDKIYEDSQPLIQINKLYYSPPKLIFSQLLGKQLSSVQLII